MQATPVADSRSATATIPESMRAVVARRYGGPEVIGNEEVPVPKPARDEVLVKVEASSLNALDWHYLTGTPYFMRLMVGLVRPKRIIPGADVAGVVVAKGSEVHDLSIGDAVFGECQGGGCAPYLASTTDRIVKIPTGVSFEAAAATPVAGLTALQALRTHCKVQEGEHVLINGAAGGVGTFSVQIAKAFGAEVTAVCSTRNVDMVQSLGADHVVDYLREDFVEGGARFEVMIDNVGNRSAAECLSVLQPDGRYAAISGPKRNRLLGPVPHIVGAALSFRRAPQSFHQFTASPNHDDLTTLGELLADGQVVPEIQRVLGPGGVADALAEIGTGHTRAKIVVVSS
ncbi:MAG: NAD(P)-dependent alcohol dehydrogenase [Acidimicrobiales bacterium]